MDRKPVIEKSAENPYCPQGWTQDDCRRAGMEFNAFKNSQAWHWIGHYLGARQRILQGTMVPKKPSALTHAEYVELGARANEIISFWQAAEVLTSYENIERTQIIGNLEEESL